MPRHYRLVEDEQASESDTDAEGHARWRVQDDDVPGNTDIRARETDEADTDGHLRGRSFEPTPDETVDD